MKKRKEDENLSVDRISELPEPILQAILCFLSQKNAVQTSVLSKTWRYLWCRRPVIEFDDMYESGKDAEKRKALLSALERNLQGTLHRRLDKFSLHFTQNEELISLLKEWIPRITSVTKLHLVLKRLSRLDSALLPPLAFDSESIEELHVKKFIFSHKPQNKGLYNFSRLRKLTLSDISRLPKGWFSSSCSFLCLEELTLESCSPGIFDLSSCCSLKHFEVIIDAPKLVSFHYIGRPTRHISFSSSKDWKSNIKLSCLDPADFNELTGLLKALGESEISLEIAECYIGEMCADSDMAAGVYDDELPVVVNQLVVTGSLMYYRIPPALFLNTVFRIFRPSVMHMNKVSTDVAEILVREEREYFWQHDLERVVSVCAKDVHRPRDFKHARFELQWKGVSA